MATRGRLRALAVWANGVRVGEWRAPARGPMELRYAPQWRQADERRPLSLSLPVTLDDVPLRGTAVETYFDNLLPDSDAIRCRVQERFHTATRGPFDLLTAIGQDCVGAVQLLPPDQEPVGVRRIEAEPLTDTGVAQTLAGVLSPATGNLKAEEFRISIAGAQEKAAFLKHDGRWCRPLGTTPTTHIFKLPLGLVGHMRADMSSSLENEWLCARILAAYGLPVARCDIGQFGEFKVLIVERFDRALHSTGRYWLRLMQEDLCQALAVPPHLKYEADGGPGLSQVASVLRGSVHAEEDLKTLFRAQLLFWMLAATDGHAKNFSLRILPGGYYHLTPLYDVLSAWPIVGKRSNHLPYEKAKLAMALHSTRAHYRLRDIQRRHFSELGKQLGLGGEATSLIDGMLTATADVVTSVQRGLPRSFPEQVLDPVLRGLESSVRKLGAG